MSSDEINELKLATAEALAIANRQLEQNERLLCRAQEALKSSQRMISDLQARLVAAGRRNAELEVALQLRADLGSFTDELENQSPQNTRD